MRSERLALIKEVFNPKGKWIMLGKLNMPPHIKDAIEFLLSEIDMREKNNQIMLKALKKIMRECEWNEPDGGWPDEDNSEKNKITAIAQAAIDAAEGKEVGI